MRNKKTEMNVIPTHESLYVMGVFESVINGMGISEGVYDIVVPNIAQFPGELWNLPEQIFKDVVNGDTRGVDCYTPETLKKIIDISSPLPKLKNEYLFFSRIYVPGAGLSTLYIFYLNLNPGYEENFIYPLTKFICAEESNDLPDDLLRPYVRKGKDCGKRLVPYINTFRNNKTIEK